MIQCLKYLRTSAHFITATCLHLSQNPQREICVGTYRDLMLEVPSYVGAFHHDNLLCIYRKICKGGSALELTMIQCLKYLRTSAHFITATCLHLSQNPQREMCVGTYHDSMLEVPSYVSVFHHGNLLASIAKSAKGDVRWILA